MKKVIVTVLFRGKKLSRIMDCVVCNGKTCVPQDAVEQMAKELGAKNGETYSIY